VQDTSTQLPLDKIKLPPGFEIKVYAHDVKNARSLAMSPTGRLFVSSKEAGNVYVVEDANKDYTSDNKWTIVSSGMKQPNGVALKDGDLYVAEISKIWKFPQIESNLDKPVQELFYDQYPDKEHHGWKYIAFGPDGNLYVPVGAPCNICESKDEVYASITRLNLTTKKMEVVQHGIRNTVGFTWHPLTKEMWFTDNGGDWLGDDTPACELNYAPKEQMNFGFPYCHAGDLLDPKFGDGKKCADYTPPAQRLGPHVAPLGLEFYTGNMFPAEYKNQIFIAEHGSWNRSTPIGYRIMVVKLDGNKAISYEPFAEGWLQGGEAWGRPVDIELLSDGSMLVSDDMAGVVYRISYKG
ncbi:MAG: PQQ-dependent sugar dehydrogenase, partial [Bacteroidota bacterium]|nr:PQQ-dependent sugar dehydrogenase [Bacteroidota bacterium]